MFTSGHEFAVAEEPAWWTSYELLQVCDRALREVDELLQDLRRPYRFKARGVAGVEEPERLKVHIPTDNWLPVDTRIQVTNAARLVQRLGERQLYGDDNTAPLRELIQNACDAVRARRLLESRAANWGDVIVRLGEEDRGKWIEIEDNGVGMTTRVLTGPFLDCGNSLWSAALAREEFPGLQATGFSPTGQFGIGFFSVFMWGSRVRIVTRRFKSGQEDTLVMEFSGGLETRPILRKALAGEQRADGGTTVRTWLDLEFRATERWPFVATEMAETCIWLFPTLDVNLYVDDNCGKRIRAISVSDLPRPSRKDVMSLLTTLSQGQDALDPQDVKRLVQGLRIYAESFNDDQKAAMLELLKRLDERM